MTDKDIQEYFNTEHGKPVKKFIEQESQDAVVCGVTTDRFRRYIHCWSPVWKTIDVVQERASSFCRGEEIQRGDIVTVYKYDGGTYYIGNNKTTEQILQKGLEKILKKFDDAQRHNILCISEFQRLNKLK